MMIVGRQTQWFIDLITVLTRKLLTVRYQSSVLGYLWSVLNPLCFAFIYFIVFSLYMRFGIENYIIVLLSALFPWQWIANTMGESPHTFISNKQLVKKVAFPRWAIPLVDCLQNLIHFAITIPVFLVFKVFHDMYPAVCWLYGIPLLILLNGMLLYGASLFIGTVNVFFRDLGNLVIVIIQMAFFATPIIYTIAKIPEKYTKFLYYNPFAPIIICWRSLLLDNELNWYWISIAALYSSIAMIVGLIMYNKMQYKFAEVL